jgi:phospholipase C
MTTYDRLRRKLAPSLALSFALATVSLQLATTAPSRAVSPPTIVAFAPPSGAVGTPVTITGSGFAPVTEVTPIEHVLILFQENHSFDNVLGKLCVDVRDGVITRPGWNSACDGTTVGTLPDGTSIPLSQATDIVPPVDHRIAAQQTAIDGGAMDGFGRIGHCTRSWGYACYAQYDPLAGPCGITGTRSCIPNLVALAEAFTISDRTFESAPTPSWASHVVLGAGTLNGFFTDNPTRSDFTTQTGPGSGCDSYKDASWWDGNGFVKVPSCIPDRLGQGPYRASPVPYVPTIFDRLDEAGLSWKLYGGSGDPANAYGWTICPIFYECLDPAGTQRANFVRAKAVLSDAAAGNLPSFSILTPCCGNSQHNTNSMARGDNWIGRVVSAIETGPDWSSTAIFITYDDCGCFYDHVDPLAYDPSWGVRLPMVIVGPYAKPGFTDPTPATTLSMLAFTEHNFGLKPLSADVTSAYDFSNAFDYTQAPSRGIPMVRTRVPAAERTRLAAHPPSCEDGDRHPHR